MAKNIEINIKGSDGNYEVLYPKTNSSTSVINQNIINQFGLAEGSGLEDVLGELGKYNEYWWRRRDNKVQEISKSFSKYVSNKKVDGDNSFTLYYSSTYTNDMKDFVLTNWSSDSLTVDSSNSLSTYVNKYCMVEMSSTNPPTAKYIFKILSNSTYSYQQYATGYSVYYPVFNNVEIIMNENFIGEWENLNSLDINAYTHYGIVNEKEYNFLGKLFEELINYSKINFGSYVGTGMESFNLTFEFSPKLIFINSESNYQSPSGSAVMIMTGVESFRGFYTFYHTTGTISGYKAIPYKISGNDLIINYLDLNTVSVKYYYVVLE